MGLKKYSVCLPSGPFVPFRLEEVFAYGTKKIQCLFTLGAICPFPLRRGVRFRNVKIAVSVAGTTTECPLRRGVCLPELSVNGGSTVFNSSQGF